jgi:hypothetical protein
VEGSDGSLRDLLMSHWRQEGYDPEKMPEELRPVECPKEVEYLWDYFRSMSRRRTGNGFGANPIPDEGVEAWARRRGIVLLPFENEMLDGMEQVLLSIRNKAKK